MEQTIVTRIDKQQKTKVQELANKKGLSVSGLIRFILAKILNGEINV